MWWEPQAWWFDRVYYQIIVCRESQDQDRSRNRGIHGCKVEYTHMYTACYIHVYVSIYVPTVPVRHRYIYTCTCTSHQSDIWDDRPLLSLVTWWLWIYIYKFSKFIHNSGLFMCLSVAWAYMGDNFCLFNISHNTFQTPLKPLSRFSPNLVGMTWVSLYQVCLIARWPWDNFLIFN